MTLNSLERRQRHLDVKITALRSKTPKQDQTNIRIENSLSRLENNCHLARQNLVAGLSCLSVALTTPTTAATNSPYTKHVRKCSKTSSVANTSVCSKIAASKSQTGVCLRIRPHSKCAQQTSGSGERYLPQSCSMHLHTDGRLLF